MAVLHGQKVHDSNFHFVYPTTDLVFAHYRFTIYITPRVAGFPVASYLPGALSQVRNVTESRLLLFDGEFPTIELASYLDQSLLPWDARKSFTRSVRDALLIYTQDPKQLEHRRGTLPRSRTRGPVRVCTCTLQAFEMGTNTGKSYGRRGKYFSVLIKNVQVSFNIIFIRDVFQDLIVK